MFSSSTKCGREYKCEGNSYLVRNQETSIEFSFIFRACGWPYYGVPYGLTCIIRVLVLTLACLLDHLMYGSWVLVPLNFLKFNFLSSGGDYYGTHKWHWYFTQGFSVMLFTFLPFSIAGIIRSKQWKLSGLIAWVLGLYSALGHKEFRYFLLYSEFVLLLWWIPFSFFVSSL